MTSVKRPLEGSIGSQVHLQGDAKKVKLNVQKEDIDQGKTKILHITGKLIDAFLNKVGCVFPMEIFKNFRIFESQKAFDALQIRLNDSSSDEIEMLEVIQVWTHIM